jgi:nucleotidyltransferase substrate binding protein (TIGR01987 family)
LHYWFDKFKNTHFLLHDASVQLKERKFTQLEKEGFIRRFKYTIELAWRTMNEYLESQGVLLVEATPSLVIKKASTSKLISEYQVWMDALDARNKVSRTYDFRKFEEVIIAVQKQYLTVIEELYLKLLDQYLTEEPSLST